MKRWFRKVLSSDGRPTRFHTLRGELMPLSAWIQLPLVLFRRLARLETGEPWFVPAAVTALEGLITDRFVIFEFGSGASTLWFSERAGEVISVENNPAWYREVSSRLRDAGAANCELKMIPIEDFLAEIGGYPDEHFDLVVVDCAQNDAVSRNDCVIASLPKVKPGGYLLLDDSDRAQFRELDEELAGWQADRYIGCRPKPLSASETTIYRKPK